MLTYGSQVTLERQPGQVFPYLVELEKQALWSDVPMQPVYAGRWRVGSRMTVTFGRPPDRTSIGLELTALEADRRLAFTTFTGGRILWDGEYRLEPTGSTGTRVSQTGRLRFRGLWQLLEPIVSEGSGGTRSRSSTSSRRSSRRACRRHSFSACHRLSRDRAHHQYAPDTD